MDISRYTTVSRPSAYGEYEPYRFVNTKEELGKYGRLRKAYYREALQIGNSSINFSKLFDVIIHA